MALQRPLSTALGCHSCQRWILRSFISAVGGQSTVQTGRTSTPQRPFSIAHRRRNEARERIQLAEKEEEHPLNDINEETATTSNPLATESTPQASYKPPQPEHLPWYLQHQPATQTTSNPVLSRQQLPPLPTHSPPIFHPLLQHLSLELGIDDLTILDLRSLDPPPALGANLLMLVGTARSEKHLHITSDRLCRWLRSTYNLHPHADGLLGRNELKLKLKRRAKRSRLLSSVGAKATAQTEVDEGIRTGWVCVNVGRVEGGEVPGRERRMENVVGFGPSEQGCSVVVQLLTEEKRGEMDLESLWEDNMVRARQVKLEGEKLGREVDARESTGESSARSEQDPSAMATGYHQYASVSNSSIGQQVRAYHTSSRNLQATARQQHVEPDDYFSLAAKPSTMTTASKRPYEAPPVPADASKLANMLAELKSNPPEEALQLLGQNILTASRHLSLDPEIDTDNLTSLPDETLPEATPFLRTFYATMPPYPTPAHWHEHIALLAHARQLGIHEISSSVLMAQLRNMQIAGLVPEERTFKLVVESALAPLIPLTSPEGENAKSQPSTQKLQNILAVLEDMEASGYDPISPEILSLFRSAYISPTQVATPLDLKTVVSQLTLSRLRRLAVEGDWPAFWRTWHSYPQRFLPRSAGMYTILFSALAEGLLADPRLRVEVLRDALEDLGREQPAVVLEEDGDLADAVARALEVVEPGLRDVGKKEGGGLGGLDREWRGWYLRCLDVKDGR